MKTKWKDTTGYGSGDKERVPRTWELPVPNLGRIIVTRYKDGEPDKWYLTCYDLNMRYHELVGFNLDEAQDEAIHSVYRRLLAMTQSLEDIVNAKS